MKNGLIVARNASNVIGVLEGWDRLVFRGCCPLFMFVDGMHRLSRQLPSASVACPRLDSQSQGSTSLPRHRQRSKNSERPARCTNRNTPTT